MVVLTADMVGCGKKNNMQIVYCHTNCIDMVVFEQKSQMQLVFLCTNCSCFLIQFFLKKEISFLLNRVE